MMVRRAVRLGRRHRTGGCPCHFVVGSGPGHGISGVVGEGDRQRCALKTAAVVVDADDAKPHGVRHGSLAAAVKAVFRGRARDQRRITVGRHGVLVRTDVVRIGILPDHFVVTVHYVRPTLVGIEADGLFSPVRGGAAVKRQEADVADLGWVEG